MPNELAIAAPRAEDLTRVITVGAGAGITGVVEGVVVKMAPQLGAIEPLFKWGTLLGVPLMGVGVALFTKGMLSDLALGIACGGLGVSGYVLPELVAPLVPVAGRPRLPGNSGVKLLGAGVGDALARAQSLGARVGIEF